MSTSLWFENPQYLLRHELRNFLRGESPWREDGWKAPSPRYRTGVFPPVNIYDDGEGYMIRAEMPGVDKDSLDISCQNDQVILRGERTLDTVGEEANFHRSEREAGSFRRAVSLPQSINPDKVTAEYQQGILQIFCPRAEETKARKIDIK